MCENVVAFCHYERRRTMHIIVDSRGYVSESVSYRDKETKQPKSKRVNIGQSIDGVFYPNAYYRERMAKKELAECKEELERLKLVIAEKEAGTEKEEKKTAKAVKKAVQSRQKEGLTHVFEKIAEKEGIKEALVETFDDETTVNKIISSGEYFLVSQCEPVDDFNYFNDTHNHSHNDDISSSDFSRLFASITEENVNTFFSNLNKKNPRVGKNESTYHSFDSTAISSYSDDLSDVEVSKGKQDPDLKHFAIAAVHSAVTNRCAYYRLYRGNIPDSKTIENFVSVTKEMGYPFKKVTVDKAYCTAENIYLIHNELKAEMLAMVPHNHNTHLKAVDKVRGTFENKAEKYISGQEVYGTTVPEDIVFKGKEKEVKLHAFVHVYFSPSRKAEETTKLHAELEDRITALNLAFEKGKITKKDAVDRKFSAEHKACIKVVKKSNTKVVFEKDDAAIEEALKNAGYFTIFSTEDMTSRKAILTYRSRDGIERVFNIVKNDIGFIRALVKTDETLQGKVFCVMIAAMIVSYIRSKMAEARKNGVISRKLTFNKVVHELECIYTYKMGNETVWTEISERQRTIFKFLEIDAPVEPNSIKIKKETVKKKQLK